MSRDLLRARGVDVSVPAVVVRAVPGRLPHGGVGIVRTLGRLGVDVHLVHDDPASAVSRSRYVRSRTPWGAGDEEGRIARLVSLGERLGGRPVLIPADDVATLFVEEHAASLAGAFRFPEQPAGLVRRLASKRELAAVCARLGVPTPAIAEPRSDDDARAFVAEFGLPVVAKIVDQRRMSRAASSVFIAATEDELLAYLGRVDRGGDVILQEYVPGPPANVWMFNGYFDSSSECRFGATGRKLRQHPPYTGMTTLGVVVDNPDVRELTTTLMRGLGYRGVLDIGFRFDERDGRYKLLDANPRVGATFRLFVSRDGLDVVRALYLDLTGQPVPRTTAIEGRKWLLETHDPLSAATYRRDGTLSAAAWARSLAGVDEGALFAVDDPKPLASTLVRLGTRKAAHVARRVLRPPTVVGWFAPDATAAGGDVETSGRRESAQATVVKERFVRRAHEWRDRYAERTVYARTYRRRKARALEWIDELRLPHGTSVLEVGPGAGLVLRELAARGFATNGVDRSPQMIRLSSEAARWCARRPTLVMADATALPYRDAAFGLVIALGVVPWLDGIDACVSELRRVLSPGGSLVVSSDNSIRLVDLLDPWRSPVLARPRAALKRLLGRPPEGRHRRGARMFSPRGFEEALERGGLHVRRSSTLGFGPLTLAHRNVLRERTGFAVDTVFQALADAGLPLVQRVGSQQLVLAERSVVAARPEPRIGIEPLHGPRTRAA